LKQTYGARLVVSGRWLVVCLIEVAITKVYSKIAIIEELEKPKPVE